MMRVGVSERFGRPEHDLAHIGRIAKATESIGFDSFWTPEHLAVFTDRRDAYQESAATVLLADAPGFPDPFVTLTAVAMATNTLLVGTAVLLAPLYSPLAIARAGATLDAVSDGRFVLGVGVGWQQREYEAVGAGWADRGVLATEHVAAVRALWTQRPAMFEGTFVRFADVIAEPRPVSDPHPPILIGGDSEAALRRAAALGDGWFGWGQSGDALDRTLRRLRTLLTTAGRASDSFVIQVGVRFDGDAGRLRAFAEEVREQGVARVVVTCGPDGTVSERSLETIAAACAI